MLENIPPSTATGGVPVDVPLPVAKRRRKAPEVAVVESDDDLGSDSGSDWDPKGISEDADEPLNDLVKLKHLLLLVKLQLPDSIAASSIKRSIRLPNRT